MIFLLVLSMEGHEYLQLHFNLAHIMFAEGLNNRWKPVLV